MNDLKAVVLAAGKGTRMMTETNTMPKVLRQACGKPLLYYVLSALRFIPQKDTVLIVGYRKEDVTAAFPAYPAAVQEPQLGTGHAVRCAIEHLKDFDGTVIVTCGDMPLIREEVFRGLLEHHQKTGSVCTLLSGTTEENLPYGRVMTDEEGNFLCIVEDRDCTPEQKLIRNLNAGVYAFDCRELLACLELLRNENAQQEYYLTDVPYLMKQRGGRVTVWTTELNEQILGVNTPEQLAVVEHYLNQR
ncbi:MAG: NTP transferase domain-containing protein [Oscillospiraceae bacterium]|nr:NTP transferase domain-containing protein [Oscillospiraceae bacterium]